ncbi:MAG: ESX secretion-associated protein EspG [Nocardia sp.]|nr:ESX secretion-associated protein EspG [Nocardia sp.]
MKTRKTWDFTPDEFAYVWAQETGLTGDYPWPISILESVTDADDYDRLLLKLKSRFPPGGDPDLTGPLRVLANPDLRIVCNGWFLGSQRRVRSVGAAIGDLGVILFQKAGSSAAFGEDIKLVVTTRSNLGKHIAATMPNMTPGSAGKLVGYTPRVRGELPPKSWLRDAEGRRPVEERIRTLLHLSRTAQGYLRIDRHLHDERPYPLLFVSWIDVESPRAHGRYLVDADDNDTIITPASEQVIAQELHRRARLDQW